MAYYSFAMHHFLFLLLLLSFLVLPFIALAQSRNGTIDVGSSLTATGDNARSWLSHAGDFAFGFRKVDGNKDQFLLSIWYDKIPDQTIVWFGNNGNTVSGGSKVELTGDRGLVVSDSKGNELWRSDAIPSDQVSHAFFNDTGNFMLLRSDSSKLWASFDHPTDTLLPTQMMETGGQLLSRRSETNFSGGRFQLRLLEDGNLVLNTRNIVTNSAYAAYYISGTYDPNKTNSGYRFLMDDSGYMHILIRNGDMFNLTRRGALPTSGYYHRATLNFDGVFVQYYHPKVFTGTPDWTVAWQEPHDICLKFTENDGSGVCGFNSLCSLGESRRPNCQCPQSYSLVDPNDKYGSCNPNFSPSCDKDKGQSSGEDLYDMAEIKNANWSTSDYEHLENMNQVECRQSCLSDCFCAAVAYGPSGCWKKKLPLLNGRTSSSASSVVLIKFKKGDATSDSPPKNSTRKKNHDTLILVGAVLLGSSVICNFIIIGVSCFGFFSIYHRTEQGSSTFETNIRSFTYKELAEATDDFNEELGRGAFGIVYKGIVKTRTSNIVIAVKKLDRVTRETDNEFRTEVNVIAQTHHKNLVRLVGFCEEGEHRMLVYEFMVNRTLSDFVFGDVKPSWTQRSHIALGIASGLVYLHEECSTQIIHCDIKPQNILLDEYCNARISDFGLAKLLMMNQSRTKTAIRGTKGYVAPEWFRNTPITVKVDVYSFGVMLLEIICCRRNVEDLETGGETDILTDCVWDCFQEGRLMHELVQTDKQVLNEWEILERFVMVGIWCIQEDPSLRPTMRRVVQMLEGDMHVPKPPSPSPFF